VHLTLIPERVVVCKDLVARLLGGRTVGSPASEGPGYIGTARPAESRLTWR
jgi:hypothetical protein